jgi:hypothetical protein
MTIQEYYNELPEILASEIQTEVEERENIKNPSNSYLFTFYALQHIADYRECDDYGCFEPGTATFKNASGSILGEVHGFMRSCNNDGLYELNLYYSVYAECTEGKIMDLTQMTYNRAVDRVIGYYEKALRDYTSTDPRQKDYKLAKWIYTHGDEDIAHINVCVITNCYISDKTFKKRRDKGSRNILVRFGKDNIWDIDRMYSLFSDFKEREPINVDFEDEFQTDIPCVMSNIDNDRYYSLLAVVPGNVLYELYENYMDRLLECNVRLFLGIKKTKSKRKKTVNEEIRDTLVEIPDMFLAYNNGISATGVDAELKINSDNHTGYIKSIKDFQIVNGGQTTVSIFKAKDELDVDLSSVYVQMKLTIVRNVDQLNDEITAISKCSNRQNAVKYTDFSSNNKFNRTLENIFNNEYKENLKTHAMTRWYFDRKVGQYQQEINRMTSRRDKDTFMEKTPKSQVFKKEYVAQLELSWNGQPFLAARPLQECYTYFMEKLDSKSDVPSLIYAQDLKALIILHNAIISCKNFKTNGKSYLAYYALAYLHSKYPNFSLYKIYQMQYVPDDLLDCLVLCAHTIKVYEQDADNYDLKDKLKSESYWGIIENDLNYTLPDNTISKYMKDEFEDSHRNLEEQINVLPTLENHDRISHKGRVFWSWVSDNIDDVKSSLLDSIVAKLIRRQVYTIEETNYALSLCDKYDNINYKWNDDIKEVNENDSINLAWSLFSISNEDWNTYLALWRNTELLPNGNVNTMIAENIRNKIKFGKFNNIKYDDMHAVWENIIYLKKFKKYR